MRYQLFTHIAYRRALGASPGLESGDVHGCLHLTGVVALQRGLVRNAQKVGHSFAMPCLTTDLGPDFRDVTGAFRSAAGEGAVQNGMDGLLVPNAGSRTLVYPGKRDDEISLQSWGEIRVGLIRELVQA